MSRAGWLKPVSPPKTDSRPQGPPPRRDVEEAVNAVNQALRVINQALRVIREYRIVLREASDEINGLRERIERLDEELRVAKRDKTDAQCAQVVTFHVHVTDDASDEERLRLVSEALDRAMRRKP